ncbi:gamma-glutamyltransferase [Bradyrhizobium sp. CNPSo 4026]|nr:gamma-glutamyltransferase [Bradyrhizobium cenepequi]
MEGYAGIVGASGGGDTTYFCAADQDGNAVSGIQSNSAVFGSAVVAGRTGIVLNNRLSTFHLQAGHANELLPGKRARHTMNSPILVKKRPTMGAARHAWCRQPGSG